LRAVGRETRQIIEPLPQLLDLNDLFSDCDPHPCLILQVTSGGKVICVRVCIEHPVKNIGLRLHVAKERVS
jgi:hypothetical protein